MIVGLTGGIGSGKSTVAKLFRELNVEVIDADKIARDLVAPHQPALTAIAEHFGKELLQKEGQLDRAKLRTLIFEDIQARDWLEKLLHPLIKSEILNLAAQIPSHRYVILEIPLLFEAKFEDLVDRVLVVDAPETLQIDRVFLRDKLSTSEIQAIIKTQASRAVRLKLADDVISNDGDHEALKIQVLALHQEYSKLVS